jgi:hypothetical protein
MGKQRVSRATKFRWFDHGAASFEQTFPGTVGSLGATEPLYVCPLCDRGYRRNAIIEGQLTAEHVPPDSFGGRELVLTCKECNDAAGFDVDAHARRKESVAEALSGGVTRPLKVRVHHAGFTVSARLTGTNGSVQIAVVEKASHKGERAGFEAAGPPRPGSAVGIDFVGDSFVDRRAKMSWLKSGFLALFAVGGYRFAFDPAYEIVKQQLRSPNSALIQYFTIQTRSQERWSEWKIVDIAEPAAIGVTFGRYVAVLPRLGDLTFYKRLETYLTGQSRELGTFSGTMFEPMSRTEPTFGRTIG